jgi:tripartite-type tricarboxylate transporter receptor subunit TctC
VSVAGTPVPVIKRLHEQIVKVVALPDVQERFAAAALEPSPLSPEQFRKLIEQELQRWTKVVKEAGVKSE